GRRPGLNRGCGSGALRLGASVGIPPPDGTSSAARDLALYGRPLVRNGLAGDLRFDQKWVAAEGAVAVAAFPIVVGGEVRGVVEHFCRRLLVEDVGDALATFAAVVTTSLRNADLLERGKQEEERYRLLFESNPLPMWVVDLETLEFLAVNDEAVRHYGWSREQFLSMTLRDIRPPGELPRLLEVVSQVRAMPELVSTHAVIHHKRDGTLLDVQVTTHDIPFGGRRARMVLANDVTEVKRAEDALRGAEERLRVVVTSAPVILYATDRDGIVTVSEGRGLALLGLVPGQWVGRSIFDVYRDAPDVLGNVRRALAGEEFSAVTPVGGGPGEGLVFETQYAPLRDARGEIAGVTGVATDITERMRADMERAELLAHARAARAEAEAAERRLRDLVEGLGAIVWEADPANFRFTFVSRQAEQILGYPVDRWLSEPGFFTSLIHPEDCDAVLDASRVAVADGRDHETEYRALAADGRVVWVRSVVRLVKNEAGHVRQLRGVTLDITPRKQAEEARRQAEQRLEAVVASAPIVLFAIDRDGLFTLAVGRGLESFGLAPSALVGLSFFDVYRDDPELCAHARSALAGEEISVTVDVMAGPGAGLSLATHVVPLRDAAGHVTGAIGVATDVTRERRAEKERDESLARAEAARAEAEELERRSTFLAEATQLLAASLDYTATLTNVARLAVPKLADWCVVEMLDEDGSIRMVAAAHIEAGRVEEVRDLRQRFPHDPKAERGVPKVIRTGQAELYAEVTPPELDRHVPEIERRAIVRRHGPTASMIVPLRIRGRTLGAITLAVAESGRHYTPSDLALAEELARRAALAVDNAQLFREAEAAEQRAKFLAEASKLLAASLDHHATLASLARLAVPTLADWCSVYLVEENGAIRSVAHAHVDPAKVDLARELDQRYPIDAASDHGIARVIREAAAAVYPDIPDEALQAFAADPAHLEILRRLGLRSSIALPLRARDRTLGALALSYAESGRHYRAADVALAEELAHRAAIAVDNALLFADAQESVRVREEFLSIASHELKTPLTSLQFQVQSLLRAVRKGTLATLPPERSAGMLESAERQTRRLARLVDDLLDVSRIAAGRLALHLEDVDLARVAREAFERLADEAARAGCTVALDADAPVVGRWDHLRLDQVATNLLSNAIKYGRGKPIEAVVRGDATNATLVVRDHGIGIAPEHLVRIFERFERASPARHYAGLGLGLYIVRQIVGTHGGSVRVASDPGTGSTFTVELPRHAVGAKERESEEKG
ncbi:MAG: PAS domain S-box protein, partial [Myxococcota bacterium]